MTLEQFLILAGIVLTGTGSALVIQLFQARKTNKEAKSLEATADKIKEDINVSLWSRTKTELDSLRAENSGVRREQEITRKELEEVRNEQQALRKENMQLRGELIGLKKENNVLRVDLANAMGEVEEMQSVQRQVQDEVSKLKVENAILRDNNRKLMIVIRAYQLYQNAINARNEEVTAHGLAPLPSPDIPVLELGVVENV